MACRAPCSPTAWYLSVSLVALSLSVQSHWPLSFSTHQAGAGPRVLCPCSFLSINSLPLHTPPQYLTPPSRCSNLALSISPTMLVYLVPQPTHPALTHTLLSLPLLSYHLLTQYRGLRYSLYIVYCLYLSGRKSALQDRYLLLLLLKYCIPSNYIILGPEQAISIWVNECTLLTSIGILL